MSLNPSACSNDPVQKTGPTLAVLHKIKDVEASGDRGIQCELQSS
jgi:hypothetical protein